MTARETAKSLAPITVRVRRTTSFDRVSADLKCRLLATDETGTHYTVTVVSRIRWHQPMETLVDHHRQLEPYALADGQPMKFAKHRGDMVEHPCSRHHSYGRVLTSE